MDSTHVALFDGQLCEAISQIEYELSAANFYYERDAGIAHLIGRFVLRTPESDPYLGLGRSAYQWLGVLQGEWIDVCGPRGLAAALIFAGRGHDTANAASTNSICNPSASYGVISRGVTVQRRVTGIAHIMGRIWGGQACGDSRIETVCDRPPYDCDNCQALYFNSPNGACAFGYRIGQCQLDLMEPNLQNACMLDAAVPSSGLPVESPVGMPVAFGDTINMTPVPVTAGTSVSRTLRLTNDQDCPVRASLSIVGDHPGAGFTLGGWNGPVVIQPAQSTSVTVTANSIWAGTSVGALSIELSGEFVSVPRRFELTFAYSVLPQQTPGAFGLNSPSEGQVYVQGPQDCITFRWEHASDVEYYEAFALRRFGNEIASGGDCTTRFEVVSAATRIRGVDSWTIPTCSRPLSPGDVVDHIWWVRAVNSLPGGSRIVSSKSFADAFPNGFGCLEEFQQSFRVVAPPSPAFCQGPGACPPEFERVEAPYGDVTGDGCLTLGDYEVVLRNLGALNAEYSQGDLNFDGVIDQSDVTILGTLNPRECACEFLADCGRIGASIGTNLWAFEAECGQNFVLTDIGGYQPNDRVFVRGWMNGNTITPISILDCFKSNGFLVEDATGVCVQFEDATSGLRYNLNRSDPFVVGDVVHVVGGIKPESGSTECSTATATISGNTIQQAGRCCVTGWSPIPYCEITTFLDCHAYTISEYFENMRCDSAAPCSGGLPVE